MLPKPIPLSWNEGLSGIFGSISLAAWIFLLLPQLVENYRNGSADGISLTFLLIWFVGDVTNLAGAAWAGLVPTVIALAIYFCFADLVLVAQCMWYRSINGQEQQEELEDTNGEIDTATSERTPLVHGNVPSGQKRRISMTNNVRADNLGLPGSHRRSSAASSKYDRRRSSNTLERILEEPTRAHTWLKNAVSVVLVILAGTAGWAIAWKTGAWRPVSADQDDVDHATPLGAEILGYISAVCYLGARIPQIYKNQVERSCDGLSLLFFLLSLLGNMTYGASILFHSIEKNYVLTNLPWLIGSLGTMVEDAIIFVQFHAFGDKESKLRDAAIYDDDE